MSDPICTNLADHPQGRTYRQRNMAKQHGIPVGQLIEMVEDDEDSRFDGVRLYVVHQARDCDGTPLYDLSADRTDVEQRQTGFGNPGWVMGFPEETLAVVAPEPGPATEATRPRAVAMDRGQRHPPDESRRRDRVLAGASAARLREKRIAHLLQSCHRHRAER